MFVDLTVKATLVLLLALVVNAVLRKKSAAIRHRIWCLAFCGLLGLPVLTALLPSWRLPILPQVAETVMIAGAVGGHVPMEQVSLADAATSGLNDKSTNPRTDASALDFAVSNQTVFDAARQIPPTTGSAGADATTGELPSLPVANHPEHTARAAVPWWERWIGVTWLVGFCLFGWPLVVGAVRQHRLRSTAQEIKVESESALVESLSSDLSLHRRVRLLETGRAVIPMTWGVLRPIVLFPSAWREWTLRRRRLVLLHELAHVKRFDVALQIVARLACVAYWFHPLVWYALKRLRIERELACDDCVLMTGARPSEYA